MFDHLYNFQLIYNEKYLSHVWWNLCVDEFYEAIINSMYLGII
jgi:hypothetical protein